MHWREGWGPVLSSIDTQFEEDIEETADHVSAVDGSDGVLAGGVQGRAFTQHDALWEISTRGIHAKHIHVKDAHSAVLSGGASIHADARRDVGDTPILERFAAIEGILKIQRGRERKNDWVRTHEARPYGAVWGTRQRRNAMDEPAGNHAVSEAGDREDRDFIRWTVVTAHRRDGVGGREDFLRRVANQAIETAIGLQRHGHTIGAVYD